MKAFLTIVLVAYCSYSFGQELPSFFSEAAFKEWLVRKDVKCLKFVDNGALHFDEESINQSDRIAQGIIEYWFNDEGVLDFIRYKEFDISLLGDTDWTKEKYDFVLKELMPNLPFSDLKIEEKEFQDYSESILFPDVKVNFMCDAIAPDGTVFSGCLSIQDKNYPYALSYRYRLNQEIHFEYGEVSSINCFGYIGDFYVPQLEVVEYEPLNDSVSVLTAKAHVNYWENDQQYLFGKDTLFDYPFYRKISLDKSRLEFGIRKKNITGEYKYVPFKIVSSAESKNEVLTQTTQAYYHSKLISPFCLNYSGRYLSDNSFEDFGPIMVSKEQFLKSTFNYASEKRVIKTTRKGSKIKRYSLTDSKWSLTSIETRKEDKHSRAFFYDGNRIKSNKVLIELDESQNPIILKKTDTQEEIVFSISNDSILLSEHENLYGTFLIVYK